MSRVFVITLASLCSLAFGDEVMFRRPFVFSAAPPSSWAPTGVLAYFDFSVSPTPTNEGYSNITLTAVNNPGWSNAVPGRSGGAYWFEGTNVGLAGYQKLVSDTRYPSAGVAMDRDWFVAFAWRPARLGGVGDEVGAVGSKVSAGTPAYGGCMFSHYVNGITYSYYFTDGGYKYAQQSGFSAGTWYFMIFKAVNGVMYSRQYGGSTVTGASFNTATTSADTNRWIIGGSDYASGGDSQAYRGYIAKWALGTGLTEAEETNLLKHLSQ